MKRSELEKYIGKHVRITLDNNRVEEGYLYKTRDEKFKNNPNLYFPDKRYFTTETKSSRNSNSWIFRCSHVKKLVLMDEHRIGDVSK